MLAIDVGNTEMTLGLFSGTTLRAPPPELPERAG